MREVFLLLFSAFSRTAGSIGISLSEGAGSRGLSVRSSKGRALATQNQRKRAIKKFPEALQAHLRTSPATPLFLFRRAVSEMPMKTQFSERRLAFRNEARRFSGAKRVINADAVWKPRIASPRLKAVPRGAGAPFRETKHASFPSVFMDSIDKSGAAFYNKCSMDFQAPRHRGISPEGGASAWLRR